MTEAGKISRYSASAGSGKTYKLAGIYLDLLFRSQHNYRNILAVTFTNKAASEMKERILNTLFHLASGEDSPYLENLIHTFDSDTEKIRIRAREILDNILHDYSRFSVGTIDSFFQKVLRAFVKESGLHSGFNLILDHSIILSEAVDEMLLSVDQDDRLLRWLIEYSKYEISQGNHWNLKRRIMELGEELFKEEYRLLYNDGRIVSDKEVLRDGLGKLIAFEKSFSSGLSELAAAALSIIDISGVSTDDLKGKSQSIIKFLNIARNSVPDVLSSSMKKAWEEDAYFSGKTPSASLAVAFRTGLKEKVNELCEYFDYGIRIYKSSRLVTANLFNLGILTDLSLKVRELLAESNNFLLSDAGDFLRQIIAKDQAPFIYEKVGTRYRNFMIDEFQDTSLIQWKNFYPLISNSLSEGESNLVVGDIKQAIYRWRNSDWRILNSLEKMFDPELFDSQVLKDNWRSREKVISFNNSVFNELPGLIEQKQDLERDSISQLYSESEQNDPGIKAGGYVRIKEIRKFDKRHQNSLVLDEIPALIEEIQDNGFRGSDIGILVRKNTEGQEVINRIMDYASTVDDAKHKKYNYQVISADSLLLNKAPAIKFILASLTYINDRSDLLAKASMINFLSVIQRSNIEGCRVDYLDKENKSVLANPPFGDEFELYIQGIRYLPVFEIIDRLIAYFRLGEEKSAIPFLNTIQDLVLDLSSNETNDIAVFLEWWNNEGYKKSVASPDQDDSMQLMTIHKSKGLQFKVVILPFLSWTLGHGLSPNIWVYTDKNPFMELGAVPVSFKKEISKTHFKKYYDREKLNVTIDKLNLLYVALTRSEDCLYGFIPAGTRRDNIGSLLKDAIEQSDILPGFEEDADYENISSLSFGQAPKNTISSTELKSESLALPYHVTIDDSRLKIKVAGANYLERDSEERPAVSYGIIMHDILSEIKHRGDIDKAVNSAFTKGLLNSKERENILNRLESGFKNPMIADWFGEDNTVWLEQDILLPGKSVKRPDRVVRVNGKIMVIDYKFGEESDYHHRQVVEYMEIIKKVMKEDARGFIWYVDKEIFREVN